LDERDQTLDLDDLTQETRDLWDQKAAYWDERFGEGNEFQRVLIGPATERLLDVHAGEAVLDIACGNGAFSRRMAQLGAHVVASDFSSVFIERARWRSAEYVDRIDYHVVDATKEDQLLALGEGQFDAAVASMALMDMPTIEPLASALVRLLKPGGRFVFSVQHPCFNSNAATMLAQVMYGSDREFVEHSMKVTGYLDVPPGKGTGMPGEPVPHYYFHRPLTQLFGVFFRAGLVLNGIEEPAFSGGNGNRSLSWGSYSQIPPVLVARMLLNPSP
jgi:2-polyprenyl-3-methyl-5-hydroxy-6-metoxy-1,4-benzoquinol methylase